MKKLTDKIRDRTGYFKGEGVFGSVLAVLFFIGVVIILSSPIWLTVLGFLFVSNFVD